MGETSEGCSHKRFKIALSFPGEHRDFVGKVANYLSTRIDPKSVLYDQYYEAEFARVNLDTYLQDLYHDESELIAVFLCSDYEHKDWCGLEWRAIRDLIKKRQISTIMPLRFDNTEIPGLFSTDGYVWIDNRSAKDIAKLILERYQINSGVTNSDIQIEEKEAITETDNIPVLINFENHIQFQNQIRAKIEKELSKESVKPLRDGFKEIVWNNAGKVGNPSIPELVNELFVTDQETGCVNSESMLKMLLRGTEACLEQLEVKGEKISASHIIWKTAKQILGWLATLAVRSEALANSDNENGFDEIDVETLIGVEVYTARKKDIPADFKVDTTTNSNENFRGGKQIDPGFFPETGWQSQDVINQILLIIWKAVGNKERNTPLTPTELEQLNETLRLHRARRRNSLNYYFAMKKTANHPLLNPDICNQIKTKLPELTIVHVGSETANGALLMISEGVLVAHIEAFLNLIEQYQ